MCYYPGSFITVAVYIWLRKYLLKIINNKWWAPSTFKEEYFRGERLCNIFQHKKRNFLSSSGHVKFSVTFYVLQDSYKKLQPFLRIFQGLFKGHIRFSRTTYFVEILEGWVGGGGGRQFLANMENPGRWGVLSENPSVVGYGYFLEPHIYDLYSTLDNQKALKTTFHATTFTVEENSRTCTEI